MVEEIGSMEIVGRIDNSQIMIQMDALRRSMRSTSSETVSFAGAMTKLGAAAGIATGTIAGLVGLAGVGPNTQVAMARLGAWATQVSLAADRVLGEPIQKITDFITGISPEAAGGMAIGGIIGGGIGGLLGLFFGGPAGAAIGAGIGVGVGTLIGGLAPLLAEVFSTPIKSREQTLLENSIDYTEGAGFGGTKGGAPQVSGIPGWDPTQPIWVPELNVTKLNINISDLLSVS